MLLKASARDEFAFLVARIPEFEWRDRIPTVMWLARPGKPSGSLEDFVATPEFWRQREPDLLAAFPGRSIDADPLRRFFERFGNNSDEE